MFNGLILTDHIVKKAWFIHYFHENYFRQVEGMAYPAITSTVVSNSLMPMPPFPEQVQIASILSGVDAIQNLFWPIKTCVGLVMFLILLRVVKL